MIQFGLEEGMCFVKPWNSYNVSIRKGESHLSLHLLSFCSVVLISSESAD